MAIVVGLLILLFLTFFLVSAAIIYHLLKYGPEKDQTIKLVGVYGIVSFILIAFAIIEFVRIDWENLF